MELSADKVKSLMSLVYDASYFGSPNDRDEIVQKLVSDCVQQESRAFRIYTVEELKKLPEGTIFDHSKRGRCWITAKADGGKCVSFQTGGTINLILNGNPWDQPMRMVYSEKG